MSPAHIRRRDLLIALGMTTGAGCLQGIGSLTDEGVTIGQIGIQNSDQSPHEVSILLKSGGKTLLDETITVDGLNKKVIKPSWPGTEGSYIVKAGLPPDDGYSVEFGPEGAGSNADECIIISISIQSSGDALNIGYADRADIGHGLCPQDMNKL